MVELGHLVFGNFNETCDKGIDRQVFQDLYWHILSKIDKDFEPDREFENDTFIIRPYYWGDDEKIACLPNFEHKPSGFKMTWYKYPLRDAYTNIELDANKFSCILYDCLNSTSKHVKHCINEWWKQEISTESAHGS